MIDAPHVDWQRAAMSVVSLTLTLDLATRVTSAAGSRLGGCFEEPEHVADLDTNTDYLSTGLVDPYDFDGDGELDIIGFTNRNGGIPSSYGNFYWYRSIGSSLYRINGVGAYPYITGECQVDIQRVVLLERNDSSRPDVLINDPPLQYEYNADERTHVLRTTYDPTFQGCGGVPDWIHTTDFDLDGFDDLVQLKLLGEEHLVRLYRGSANAELTLMQNFTWTYDVSGDKCFGSGSGDLDGDGYPDLVVACTNEVHWYMFDPEHFELVNRTFIIEDLDIAQLNDDGFQLSIGRINNDDTLDVLMIDRYFLNKEGSNGTEWDEEFLPVLDNYAFDAVTRLADVNNDGFLDIVALTYDSPTLLWVENFQGEGYSSNPVVLFSLTNAPDSRFFVYDFNNDGLVDIVWNEKFDIYLQHNAYCPTPSPTALPTPSPTSQPSTPPTPSPTNVPTRLPTGTPTASPTATPTTMPTSDSGLGNSLDPVDEGDSSGRRRTVTISVAVVVSFFGTLACLMAAYKCIPQLKRNPSNTKSASFLKENSRSVSCSYSLPPIYSSDSGPTRASAPLAIEQEPTNGGDAVKPPQQNLDCSSTNLEDAELSSIDAKPSAPAPRVADKQEAVADYKPEKEDNGIYKPDLDQVAFMDVYDGVNADMTTDNDVAEMETDSSIQVYDHADNIMLSNDEDDEDSYLDYHTN